MPVQDAQQFAREVSAGMVRLRGWTPLTVTREVLDDVFHTLDRHSGIYSRGFSTRLDPKVVAQQVQDAEWSLR